VQYEVLDGGDPIGSGNPAEESARLGDHVVVDEWTVLWRLPYEVIDGSIAPMNCQMGHEPAVPA
jgi:hypothetical protein